MMIEIVITSIICSTLFAITAKVCNTIANINPNLLRNKERTLELEMKDREAERKHETLLLGGKFE